MYRFDWKSALIAASLVLTANAYAKDYKDAAIPCPEPPKLKEGWYIGGQVGYDSFRNANIIETPGFSGWVSHPRFGVYGWAGGILLGYGYMYNTWLYTGYEIFADTSNFSQDFTMTAPGTPNYTSRFTSQSMIGFGFLPGIKITDSTITYAKLGWNRAVIKSEETSTGAVNATRTNDSMGFVFGFGIETLLKNNWSMRTEYDHIYLNSFNTPVPYGTKITPSDNQFMAALIYHFEPSQVVGEVTGQ